MLKTPRKPLSVAVLLLCIAASSLVAYGYLFVTSNEVHVNMQYKVALSRSVTDSNVTLTATVTNNGAAVEAGITVDFYYSIDSGANWISFASKKTDSGGIAQAIYTATYNGGYDFEAVVTVP